VRGRREGGGLLMKAISALMIVLVAVVAGVACAGGGVLNNAAPPTSPGAGSAGIVAPTWVTPEVQGDTVSIPLSEVQSGKMVHFRVESNGSDMAFMAYRLGGQTYVRASICPPCRSQSFSLAGDVLDCDNCHTKFNASTGAGISGPCVNYPKAAAPFVVGGDRITMQMGDLVTAYIGTLEPGWP